MHPSSGVNLWLTKQPQWGTMTIMQEVEPIYLLEVFGKNEKANLAAAERNALAKVAAKIKQQLQRRKR